MPVLLNDICFLPGQHLLYAQHCAPPPPAGLGRVTPWLSFLTLNRFSWLVSGRLTGMCALVSSSFSDALRSM